MSHSSVILFTKRASVCENRTKKGCTSSSCLLHINSTFTSCHSPYHKRELFFIKPRVKIYTSDSCYSNALHFSCYHVKMSWMTIVFFSRTAHWCIKNTSVQHNPAAADWNSQCDFCWPPNIPELSLSSWYTLLERSHDHNRTPVLSRGRLLPCILVSDPIQWCPVVKVDRRIRWHYTTTILRLRIGARLTASLIKAANQQPSR